MEMIKVEKERTLIRFEWEKVEHELRVEALHLEVEMKKKCFAKYKFKIVI